MEAKKRETPKSVDPKKFVHYKEGDGLYSMSVSRFEELAKQVGAVHNRNKLLLVNKVIFEEYLEMFRVVGGVRYGNEERTKA